MSLVFNMVGGGGNGGGIKLTGIAVTKAPLKTAYKAGETFDAAGMVVTATYSNGAKLDNPAYTVAPSGALAVGTTTVTISYSEGGVTKTATQKISVTRTMLTVPAQSGTLTYTGGAQSPAWSNYDTGKMTLGGTTSGTNAGSYNATFALKDTALYCWPDDDTAPKTVAWSIAKAAGTLTLSKTEVTLKPDTTSDTFTLTTNSTGAITAESGAPDVVSVKVSGNTVTVESVGNKSGTAVITVSVAGDANHTAPASKTCTVKCSFVGIFGVEWDWTSGGSTKGTRTDAAASFGDPSPAVNNGTGSSPFDNLMPWSGMVKETRAGGVEVKEPKYWFKWTKTGKKLKLQIADGPVEGFSVDPVNRDRGDGLGELDYSYIGRYHCGSDYRSITGAAQQVNITRSQARSGIHSLGANFWQIDFAQFWYVNMLFLVEFADWNGERIGRGCSANGFRVVNGQTDAMGYHTGTTAASRDSYGFTQYRNIEGWWDNVYDGMDGCYYNNNGLNVIRNPNNFSDSANGTLVGTPSSGYPSDFTIPTASGLEWALFPSAANGSQTTYVPDYWNFNGRYPCLYHGGDYGWGPTPGPFYIGCYDASSAYATIGCRLQERPPKAA